jgi:hypothetical protein
MVVRTFRNILLCAAVTGCCYARQASHSPAQVPQSNSAAPPSAGLETPWDVRTILAKLNADTGELKPLLDSMKPQQWYDQKGAPSTYILQWQTAERQVNDVSEASKMLSQKTESLSLALDDYFRLEALDVTTRSLEEGVRKYGDRSTAERLSQLLARNFNNRERFRDYIRDLALSTEQNFKIADEEAQRCRGMISREPASGSKKLRK